MWTSCVFARIARMRSATRVWSSTSSTRPPASDFAHCGTPPDCMPISFARRHAQQHLVVERLEAREVLDARHEGDVVDWLGQEVVGSGLEPLHLVGRLIQRGDHHDGHVHGLGRALDEAAHLEAVHARHHHVEQHHVDALELHQLEGLRPRIGREHIEVLGREPRLQQLDVGKDVVNDEYTACHRLPSKRQEPRGCGSHASPRYRRTVSRNVPIDIGFEM